MAPRRSMESPGKLRHHHLNLCDEKVEGKTMKKNNMLKIALFFCQ